MVEIDFKIVITGIVCLTLIYGMLIYYDHDSSIIATMIVTVIALAIGIIIPSPQINNKTGVLKW